MESQTGANQDIIIGHKGVDHDAAFSLYLLSAYGGYEGARIEFVDARNPDPVLMERAAAVVDVGLVWDEGARRFDHHGPSVAHLPDTCAATLVADWLNREGVDVSHLEPLIKLIMALDTGKITAESRLSDALGIHAALRGLSRAGAGSDEQLTRLCFALYKGLDEELKSRRAAELALDASTLYQSPCKRFRVVSEQDRTIADMAGESGAEVVLFAYTHEVMQPRELEFGGIPAEADTKTSQAVALRRTDRLAAAPDLGKAVGIAMELMGNDERRERQRRGNTVKAAEIAKARAEVRRWYLHPNGYYAGRGIEAAPCYEPLEASLELIGRYLERAIWETRAAPLRKAHTMSPVISRFAPMAAALWATLLLSMLRMLPSVMMLAVPIWGIMAQGG